LQLAAFSLQLSAFSLQLSAFGLQLFSASKLKKNRTLSRNEQGAIIVQKKLRRKL
jgi:hypothetical protein